MLRMLQVLHLLQLLRGLDRGRKVASEPGAADGGGCHMRVGCAEDLVSKIPL